MLIRLLALTLLALSAPSAAFADADVQLATANGFAFRAPVVERGEAHVSIRGAVCRRAFAAGRPRFVQLDLIDASGLVVASHVAPVRGVHGYRGGCGFYDVGGPAPRETERFALSLARRM